ncbi:MAG: NAD-binding protein [Treponema sp.]|nr:NAD-binding protein [Treponema sp.]
MTIRKILRKVKEIVKNPLTYLWIAVPVVMTVLVLLIFKYEAGVSMESLADSLWNFLVIFVAGYYDICVVTPLGRFYSFIILILGILVGSAVTGKIASVFMDAQMKKDKGLAKIKTMEGHFLLCGWRDDFEKILDSVLKSNPDITPEMIVLVNDAPAEDVEQLRAEKRFKAISYVSGDFSDESTLKRAHVETATRALIIADRAKKFSRLETDSRTVLSALTISSLNPSVYIAAEISDAKFKKHLEMAHCDEIIMTTNYEYSLLATASSGVGYSNVIMELIGDDAYSGIIIEDIPSRFIGKTYKEFKDSLEQDSSSILIGLLMNTGNFYQRRKEALREAQKNPDVKKIVSNLQKVKLLKSNAPLLAPSDDVVIQQSTKAIFVRGKEAENEKDGN